jgi:hypothetical protein
MLFSEKYEQVRYYLSTFINAAAALAFSTISSTVVSTVSLTNATPIRR